MGSEEEQFGGNNQETRKILEVIDEADHPPKDNGSSSSPSSSTPPSYARWLRVAIYAVFLLAGQSAATLLGRLYFDKGGKGLWTATLVRVVGFPIIIPLYILTLSPKEAKPRSDTKERMEWRSVMVLTSVYVSLGIFQAAVCMFHSLGLFYLPVVSYSLICASQLAFNAVFSFFLNSLKPAPAIVNSVVLLTVSSTLLVFQNGSFGSSDEDIPTGKYSIGFISTIAGSAGYGLFLCLTQLCFKKVIKQANVKAVLDMILYPTIVATLVVLVGFFASGEFRGATKEMDRFEMGRVSYIMTLSWTAICWQMFSIGATGLILEVTSLFSNVVSTLGLPLLPVTAVFVFHDKITGITVVAMALAVWGFVSYLYQQYLDQESVSAAGKQLEAAASREVEAVSNA